MSTPVTERVDNWTERPFGGGYRELQNLADSEFSGVVRAAGAELFMTKGTVVGILQGSIADFEDASGTVYDAPTDALPLLAVMQERSDEVRAKYYSEETSLSEVDQTLEDGKFTGYVELSENVLSGDYYLVYHQGRSMSAAFVGNAEQLLTDDEAFQRANGEVGIFKVRPVAIDPVEIPEPPEPEPDPKPDDPEPIGAGDIDDDPETTATEPPSDPTPAEAAETVVESDTASETVPDPSQSVDKPVGDEPVDDEPAAGTESTVTEPSASAATDPDERSPGVDDDALSKPDTGKSGSAVDPEPDSPEPNRDGDSDATEQASGVERDGQPGSSEAEASSTPDVSTRSETVDTASERTSAQSTPEDAAPAGSDPVQDETEPETPAETQQDVSPTPTTERAGDGESIPDDPSSLETHAIPSLDPEQTSTHSQSTEPRRDAPGRDRDTGARGGSGQAAEQLESQQREQKSASPQDDANDRDTRAADPQEQSGTATQEPATTETTASPEQESPDETEPEPDESDSEGISELQDLLAEREKEINRLEADLKTAESERESVRRELEQVRAERDELENQVQKLERDLQQLEEELGAATDAQQRMTPQEALSGTDIFVRYRSKGDATLEKAHEGGAVKKDFSDNLRLEKHTQFDADISAVGGREYDEFLEGTVAYKFVRWVVEELLFEIQSTGHTETLGDLYDALPKINRVELNGAVSVTVSENGQETESTETFDVVFRERMGDPLLVANINDSRQGASETMMEGLITAAERVGQTSDQFASAFLVTESFFEPEALETVAEATRGGILSRDKRKSFVNLSRKRGYHLCLVEARNQNFHLEVPEL